jgi:hypothetical protein
LFAVKKTVQRLYAGNLTLVSAKVRNNGCLLQISEYDQGIPKYSQVLEKSKNYVVEDGNLPHIPPDSKPQALF